MSAPTPRPWAENALPTAEQLAEWLGACTDEERTEFAGHFLRVSDESARCFREDHQGAKFVAERSAAAVRDAYESGFRDACERISDGLAAQS